MSEETQLIEAPKAGSKTRTISTTLYPNSSLNSGVTEVNSDTTNPTRQALERSIAQLEEAVAGFAFSSGWAAVDSVLKLLSKGDEIVAADDIYGGSFRLFENIYSRFGINVKYVDTSEVDEIKKALTPRTKAIWIETPTNPTLKVSDIKAISEISKKINALLVVDNTSASPALQKPLTLGADIVVHNATKYLGNRSNVMAGLVAVGSEHLAEKISAIQSSTNEVLSALDSWSVIRGIQTLHLRIEKECNNAFAIAKFLEQLDEVDKVYYPGLIQHKNHEAAKKQQKLYGEVVSFSFKDDRQKTAIEFLKNTHFFKLTEDQSGTKSLVSHPATTTHKSTPPELRHKAGIQESLVRLSCGTEQIDDLIKDLKQAIAKSKAA